MDKIWNNVEKHQGKEFYTRTSKKFIYSFHDSYIMTSLSHSEKITKDRFIKVTEYLHDGLSAAQINKKIRGSYYIIALLEDKRIAE